MHDAAGQECESARANQCTIDEAFHCASVQAVFMPARSTKSDDKIDEYEH